MLPELPEEVPEPGLGHDGVGGEDLHAVEGSHGLRLGGKLPSDHTELLQSSFGLHFSSETTLLSFLFDDNLNIKVFYSSFVQYNLQYKMQKNTEIKFSQVHEQM